MEESTLIIDHLSEVDVNDPANKPETSIAKLERKLTEWHRNRDKIEDARFDSVIEFARTLPDEDIKPLISYSDDVAFSYLLYRLYENDRYFQKPCLRCELF